ncbi:MAG TPA: pyridoxine 5'-phosphate synthase [Myxococcota bacterium]|nr:pyridoxine 5'-phosphate synthase [Myxococcota bacterium]
MRKLTLALDLLCLLREAAGLPGGELHAALALGELAGADSIRLGVGEDLRPVRERDVRDARHAARSFELRMPPAQGLLKLALEVRPDRVVLGGENRETRQPAGPLDTRTLTSGLVPFVRALREGGIPTTAIVIPELDAVKAVHAAGLAGVELYTGGIVDLPSGERAAAAERLSDAGRLAAKLRLGLVLGGGLGYRTLPELLGAVPAAERVSVGRACLARATLVGLDRAVRDMCALVA